MGAAAHGWEILTEDHCGEPSAARGTLWGMVPWPLSVDLGWTSPDLVQRWIFNFRM